MTDAGGELHKPSSDMLDLRALEEIERNPSISQRDLAVRLGVALGFANACVRNMVRRGYIKLKKARGNKFTYMITPSGIKARAALTCRAFADTVSFYSGAKEHIRGFFDSVRADGVRRIVFFGIDDLLDIIFLTVQEFDFEIIAVVDPDDTGRGNFMKIPVVTPEALKKLFPDLVVLSSLKHEQKMKRTLRTLGLDVPARTIFDLHWGGPESATDNNT